MKRLQCVLRLGLGTPTNAGACARELVRASELDDDAQRAMEVAVSLVVGQILASGPSRPGQLRMVGLSSRWRVRIMLVWSGPPLEWSQGNADTLAASSRFAAIRGLVEQWQELAVGSRRCIVLESNTRVSERSSHEGWLQQELYDAPRTVGLSAAVIP